jgi:hypothetical protein
MFGEKRERPLGTCIICGKEKPIYTHLNGDKDAPLCGACNMRMRRESPDTVQIKVVKLAIAAIGNIDSMTGLDIEQHHKQELQAMLERLKILVRLWLGDESADHVIIDVFSADRKDAVSVKCDGDFVPTSQSTSDWYSKPLAERRQIMAERSRAKLGAKQAEAEADQQPQPDPADD